MLKYFFSAFIIGLLLSSCTTDDENQYIQIETEFGDMKVMLYNSTPGHKENMIKLVNEDFYKDLLFHRVMGGFMIQGGDPNSRGAAPGARLGSGGPGYTIPAEIGSPHIKGTLSAARTPDAGNPQKASSGSQFFIVQGGIQSDALLDRMERSKGITYNEEQRRLYKELGGYPSLDNDYTVFGEVVEGLDVIDKIAAVQTDPANRPLEDIKMQIKLIK